jgi:hypothetical protein
MLLSEAMKQSIQPSEETVVDARISSGCIDCFMASLSSRRFSAAGRVREQQFAPMAQVQLRSDRSGASHRSNNSLQRTANTIKWLAQLPRRAAAELNR